MYHILMKTFGENLKEFRLLNKLSQRALAEKMKTTQQRVSEWERNQVEPTLYNIIKLIKILNVSFEELVDGVIIE